MRFLPDGAALGDTAHVRIGAARPEHHEPALIIGATPDIRLESCMQAPTAAEAVLRLLASPERVRLNDIAAVSSGEYCGDHVLAAWALCEPAAALERADTVRAAARACAYGVCTSEAATHVACLFESYPEEAGVRDAGSLFLALLPRLAAILDRPRDFDLYWIGDYSDVIQSNSMLESGAVDIEEHPNLDLAVMHTPLRLHDFTRLTATSMSRILTVRSENTYVLEYRRESWVRYPEHRVPPRIDLHPLAQRLNLFERAAGTWRAEEIDRPVSRLFLDDGRGVASPSKIDAETIVEEVLTYLREGGRLPETWWSPGIAYP
ncbi:MAG: hypothetical protein HYX51_03820 [Chloroflexi bacterium]|nr:hypothetical protein [Chloroflexota bacterium]